MDAVLMIGEHGDYPRSELGQEMLPRRYFFEQIADTIGEVGRPMPIYKDKHLSYRWDDARWMYERAKRIKLPLWPVRRCRSCGASLIGNILVGRVWIRRWSLVFTWSNVTGFMRSRSCNPRSSGVPAEKQVSDPFDACWAMRCGMLARRLSGRWCWHRTP